MDIFAVEVFGALVKIEYLDGSREEVDGGVYERKDTNGDTVEQRAATQADIDRLTQLAVDFETANPPSTEAVVDIEIIGDSIEIEYADGTKESIAGGIYERKDANNETIIERAATEEDVSRISDLAEGFGTAPNPGTGDPTAPDVTLTGTEGDDEIRGTSQNEVINGLGGNDELRGRGGDDTVNGGAGDDTERPGQCIDSGIGGFGGGGNGGNGGAGGGGYQGGHGGGDGQPTAGGGGLSYNDGVDPQMEDGVRVGHGEVIITKL